jgi:hypothetical protein
VTTHRVDRDRQNPPPLWDAVLLVLGVAIVLPIILALGVELLILAFGLVLS